jgi:hypothetical protein
MKAMFLHYGQRSITKAYGNVMVIEDPSFVIIGLAALSHFHEISTLS